jgi:hypothetical protein
MEQNMITLLTVSFKLFLMDYMQSLQKCVLTTVYKTAMF